MGFVLFHLQIRIFLSDVSNMILQLCIYDENNTSFPPIALKSSSIHTKQLIILNSCLPSDLTL